MSAELSFHLQNLKAESSLIDKETLDKGYTSSPYLDERLYWLKHHYEKITEIIGKNMKEHAESYTFAGYPYKKQVEKVSVYIDGTDIGPIDGLKMSDTIKEYTTKERPDHG